MATAANLLVKIGADISDFQNKFGQLQKGLRNTGESLKRTGKTMTTRVTAPLVALGTGAVVTAASFEKSMNNVAAISGATGDDFNALREQAKELGITTLHSASDAADGMAYLAMAGFETNEIMDAMPGMLDLATASGMDLAQTADIASNILSGFAMEASEVGNVSDILAKAASSANTDVGQLGEAMSYVAPVAQGAGLSIEETSAAIGTLSDAGIQGSRAGTALRKMISSLQNPTGKTADALEDLGLSAKDVDPSVNSLSDILRKLKDSGISSSQAMELVGDVAGPGLIAMLEQGGDGLDEFTKELENSEGSAAEMAEIMGGGMYGAFKALMGAVEGLAIEFGEVLAPAVLAVTDVLTKAVRWFANIDGQIKVVIAIIATLVAAIGPLLIVLGFMMTALSGLSVAAIKVTAVIGLVVAIIGVLVAAFIHAWNTSDEFRDAIMLAWEMIKETFAQAVEVIKEIFMGLWEFLMEVLEMFMEYWEEYGEGLIESVTEIFTTIYEAIMTAIEIIWEFIENVLEIMKELWEEHGDKVMEIIDTAFEIIWTTINSVVSAIRDFIQMVLDKITSFWDAHGDSIMKIIEFAMRFIGEIISSGMSLIQGIIDTVWPIIVGVITGAWDVISGVVEGAINVVSGLIGTLAGLLTGDFAAAWEGLKEIVSGVWIAIEGVVKGGINAVIGLINGMIGAVNNISIDIPDWVPKFGGRTFGVNIPKIPQLATGGVTLGSTLAEIGEGAHPEMVAPLNDATMRPFANLIAKHLPQDKKDSQVRKYDPIDNRPIILVSPDGRVLAEFVADDVEKITDRKGFRRRPRRNR